jgi:hypothetical protein
MHVRFWNVRRNRGEKSAEKRIWEVRNEEFHNVFCASSIIKMVKSQRAMWAGNVARKRDTIKSHKIFVGQTEGKKSLTEVGVHGDVILK